MTDVAELLRRGEKIAADDGRNPKLTGRDLWRLVAAAAASHPFKDREEREEVFSRVAVAAAEHLDGLRPIGSGRPVAVLRYIGAHLDRTVPPPMTAADLERIRADLEKVAADVVREVREERGYLVPAGSGSGDPEDGTADGLAALLAQGERVAEHSADRERRRKDPRVDLKGDPLAPHLRPLVAALKAPDRAAVCEAISPEVYSDEWSRAERTAPATWRKRKERGTLADKKTPALRPLAAGILAGLMAAVDPDRIPGTTLRVNGRDLPSLPLPNGETKQGATALPERDRIPAHLDPDGPDLAAALTHRTPARPEVLTGVGDNSPEHRPHRVGIRPGISGATFSPGRRIGPLAMVGEQFQTPATGTAKHRPDHERASLTGGSEHRPDWLRPPLAEGPEVRDAWDVSLRGALSPAD